MLRPRLPARLGGRRRGFIARGEVQGVSPFNQVLRRREGGAIRGQRGGFAVEDLNTYALRGVVVVTGAYRQQRFVGGVDLAGKRDSSGFATAGSQSFSSMVNGILEVVSPTLVNFAVRYWPRLTVCSEESVFTEHAAFTNSPLKCTVPPFTDTGATGSSA